MWWEKFKAVEDPPAEKSRGLGDTIAKITKAVGIKPCGGCKERKEKLNKLVPYGSNDAKPVDSPE